MPGMMDTILNLGLNEEVVETLAKASGNPRWAWDCYRRFIQMFSDVVMEVGKKYFEELIDKMKEEKGVKQDVDLDAMILRNLQSSSRLSTKRRSVRTSLQILRYSLWKLLRLYSVHGITQELTYTAVTMTSLIHGEQLSTYR